MTPHTGKGVSHTVVRTAKVHAFQSTKTSHSTMTLACLLMDQHILSMMEQRQRAMVQKSFVAEPTLNQLHLATMTRNTRLGLIPESFNGYHPSSAFSLPLGHMPNSTSLPCSSIPYQYGVVRPQFNRVVRATSAGGSGVYYDNREISNEIHHPAQGASRFASSEVPKSLPTGTPLPLPPRLAANGTEHRNDISDNERAVVAEPEKRKLCDDEEEDKANAPSKRARTNDSVHDPVPNAQSKSLSNEQKTFVEAALALSESSGRKGNETPTDGYKTSPILPPARSPKSPKSVMMGLPPPPFFLASNPLDLKDNLQGTRSSTASPVL